MPPCGIGKPEIDEWESHNGREDDCALEIRIVRENKKQFSVILGKDKDLSIINEFRNIHSALASNKHIWL